MKRGLRGACLKSGQGESFCQPFLLFKERSSILFLSKQCKFIFSFSHFLFIKDQLNHQLRLVDGCHLLYYETQRHLVRAIPLKVNRKTEIRG